MMPGGIPLVSILTQVDGYLFPHEAVFLYWLARSAPGDGCIVEIGSYRGRSTLCLAAGIRRRRRTRVFAVDPHVYGTAGELAANLAHFGMAELVTAVVAPSVEAAEPWREPVRLVFVDGDHQKASVEADVDAWLPHLEAGGFLLLHDSTSVGKFSGPAEVARARLRVGPEFDVVGRLGSITWARRSGARAPWLPPTHGSVILDKMIRLLKGRPVADADG